MSEVEIDVRIIKDVCKRLNALYQGDVKCIQDDHYKMILKKNHVVQNVNRPTTAILGYLHRDGTVQQDWDKGE
jgi:hypothetical protein